MPFQAKIKEAIATAALPFQQHNAARLGRRPRVAFAEIALVFLSKLFL
jgi:hypothetical protein